MQSSYFTDASSTATYLFAGTTLPSLAIQEALFNDPWYGLSNSNNYARWMALTDSEIAGLEKIGWQ